MGDSVVYLTWIPVDKKRSRTEKLASKIQRITTKSRLLQKIENTRKGNPAKSLCKVYKSQIALRTVRLMSWDVSLAVFMLETLKSSRRV